MDYIDFINSKDIRSYLRSIDYKPGLLESAFFIYSSRIKSLDEKHEGWKKLVKETDDLILDEKAGSRWAKTDRHIPETYGMSAHKLIIRHMEDEELILEYFCSSSADCVFVPEFTFYRSRYVGDTRPVYYNSESGLYFRCYEDARDYCLKEVEEDGEIVNYSIKKYLFSSSSDEHSNYVEAHFNLSGEVMSIDISACNYDRFPDKMRDYLTSREKFAADCDFFDRMWFDIPTPFRKGDVVVSSTGIWGSGNPFVLLSTDPQWRKSMAESGKPYREGGDLSDMIATGWSIGFGDNPTEIFDDEMANYLDIEYYREDFKGLERLLPLLASQIKGNIDLWEWDILKNEIIKTSLPNYKLDYMKSFPEVSMILDGSPVNSN